MAARTSEAFALAPSPAPRPLQWRRASRLIRELMDDPAATDKVFELFEAIGGRGDERSVQRFAAHAEGRHLFEERPSLLSHLADRDALDSLPDRSFGRSYLTFAERNGFAVDGLLESNQKGLGRLTDELDPQRRWFYERLNLMHDLWHVLTGYETDAGGETALLAFSLAQGLASRAIWLLLTAACARGPKREGLAFQRFVLRAWVRGRRAAPLIVQRYEELLPLPLARVRRRLDIQPLREAHPRGVFRALESTGEMVRAGA